MAALKKSSKSATSHKIAAFSEGVAVSPPSKKSFLYLIHGEDDFLVTEEARKIIAELTPKGSSEFALETIDGAASNQSEAATVFAKLFEALQSQSFFATEKVVWWRQTNLLSASATASAALVAESLSSLAELLNAGLAPGTILVITAGEIDARRSIVKTIQKLGTVTSFKVDPYKQQEQAQQAIEFAQEKAKSLGFRLDQEAAVLLVEMASGDHRTLQSEIEKITTYLGDEKTITEDAVHIVGSWRPGGVVWDLPDAIAERNLGKALRVLEDLIFMGEAPMALLFAIISRLRLLFLIRILVDAKVLRVGGDYNSFKGQLDRLPEWVTSRLPTDKKLNPLAGHPFAIWKASAGASRFTRKELQETLEGFLECNERMVSGVEARHALEEAMIKSCMQSVAT